MSLAKRAEPVTLVRSPMLTKSVSGLTTSGSSPASAVWRSRSGGRRGGTPSTACAMARIWSGVVPQQPPTRFRAP